MKLFVIAALIAVSAAARLEHLEQQQQQRQYLPPRQNSGFGFNNGLDSSKRPFGAIAGAYGTAGPDYPGYNARASFPGASDRYLPPNHGPSGLASGSVPQFSGSVNGFRGQDISSRQGLQNSFGAQPRFQSQSGVNRQYLAPHSSQDIPQQSFDEQTGYHY
ncbi:unnamed protein product [Arctia plantaginis]|uniref:Uncharacterized protein n=1 Tax=Arctia plantaginis TaxID=874455 RepID=A0A8S0Z8U6_ARCPL|nr:unnamed protein product [Arctia plantaginis]